MQDEEIIDGMAQAIWDVVTGRDREEAPGAARQCAEQIAALYAEQNGVASILDLFDKWIVATDDDNAYEFGYRLGIVDLDGVLLAPAFNVSIAGDDLVWTGTIVNMNPPSVMTGPGWNTAREKLRSAAAKKNSPYRDDQIVVGSMVDVSCGTGEVLTIEGRNAYVMITKQYGDVEFEYFDLDDLTLLRRNPDDEPKVFRTGERVVLTSPDDDTHLIAEGTVMRPSSKGWVAIELDGETRIDEYPVERVWHTNPGAIDEMMDTITVNPALFRHPEDPYAHRPSSGQRQTMKYKILPGPKHGPTPRVRRAPKRRGKKNPGVTRCEGCGAVTHASELDDRELCATCAAATGLPHQRPSEETARFPLVCKKCKRAIAELRLEPGRYIDATELSESCPGGGAHDPYQVRSEFFFLKTTDARIPGSFSSFEAAQRAARDLVPTHALIEVWHHDRGQDWLQGVATKDGWSGV